MGGKWEFWVDRGGTFTDVLALSPSGKMLVHKGLSESPLSFSGDPIVDGIRAILNLAPHQVIPFEEIKAIKLGTTMGTNALLERKGEKVALAITRGFEDALRIGYQHRPDLFKLNIQLPSMLYEEVIGISERVDANGVVRNPLDEEDTKAQCEALYQQGYCAIAIVLMHSYLNPSHEQRICDIAKEIGFQEISVSHEIANVMKLINRGDTTVLNAYLSPKIQAYVSSLQNTLCVPLYFMQSNGGLVAASKFKGKDSILSGPVGGVVGMVKTAKEAGFSKIIGFDMGGTSTDVSHYAKDYERINLSEIGGVRLRTPMMHVETIAAGGGSILHFDGQRYGVGPDSAGAFPGPACYGRGGPLTLTDCNVLLGKIQSEHFPQCFGQTGNESIDINEVKEKFNGLHKQIIDATGKSKTALDIADEYIQIGVENMINAIKKISTQRGYNIKEYVLNCFGGASPQFACLVAERLSINQVLIHPFASVLSAYGIGCADQRIIEEKSVNQLLNAQTLTDLSRLFKVLSKNINTQFNETHSQVEALVFECRLHCRLQGSDSTLDVKLGSLESIQNQFEKKHRQRFGFVAKNEALIVDSVSVEGVIENETPSLQLPLKQSGPSKNLGEGEPVRFYSQGAFHEGTLYQKKSMVEDLAIMGPALIVEANTTIVVEPGWEASLHKHQSVVLNKTTSATRQKVTDLGVDPALLEIFNNRFMNIAEQMGEVLRLTASSVNIKERLDFSCAIFDPNGELVANAPHIPVHLGSMSETVKTIVARYQEEMKPDDAFMLNSPYIGGTHLPDVTVITPVFDEKGEHLQFLVGSRAHQADIGGSTPGSIPANSHSIEEEGILINAFKMVNQGTFLEKEVVELLTSGPYPVRNVKQNINDLKAQLAANANGVILLQSLIDEYGINVVHAYMKHVKINAKKCVEELIEKLDDGQFRYEMDDGTAIQVAIKLDKQSKKIHIDFTGTSDQHHGNFNAPKAVCLAAIIYVLRCLIDKDIPLNSGCFEPIELVIPKGSLLDPVYPAAVVAGNVETSQCIVDTLLGALGVVAASQGTCNNITFGNEQYQYYETLCGGSGAGLDFNGASAVHTHMTNTYLTDPEILEHRFPVLLDSFSIRQGSGGQGEFYGGEGVVRKIRFLAPMSVNILSSHRIIPPYGLNAGTPGKVGMNSVIKANNQVQELKGCASITVSENDILVIETPGGGGQGR